MPLHPLSSPCLFHEIQTYLLNLHVRCLTWTPAGGSTWRQMFPELHPDTHEELDQIGWKKSGDLMFVWLWCAKVYSLFLLYIQLYFAPTLPLHPAPRTGGIPMSPVTVTVTIANQSSPAERRQPNKEEQKKGLLSVCFFLLNSNKYIEMQWFLLYPFLLSRRVKKFFYFCFYFFLFLYWSVLDL